MSLNTKRIIIAIVGLAFLGSLLLVQGMEVARKRQEAGLVAKPVAIPEGSKACVDCHAEASPGIVEHYTGSTHARKGIGCVECHEARDTDADAFSHYGVTIATVVTPLDCSRCHRTEFEEFTASHHAKAGNILHSLDNTLAETVEGSRVPFDPHSVTPGFTPRGGDARVNGMASALVGCQQCHGSKVALRGRDGTKVTLDELVPGSDGTPTNADALALVERDEQGRPQLHSDTWPNTGIGRLNLDGSRGSCSACHSRHDFSPRRARQPENCGKCHLGPDHPQKEIYDESKHGIAYRDLLAQMALDAESWVLGKDYSAAPTCATCHMSGNLRNGGKITHDPGERISWTNRPPVSLVMDTDAEHRVVTETDPAQRSALVVDTAQKKRTRMTDVCLHCHSDGYVAGFYAQYDDFVVLYNEKFAKPGEQIVAALRDAQLLTKTQFDEELEWTWFYLWHHEGRRARHGAAMMAPDYAHWHGMYEVAERFYMELVPQARELAHAAAARGEHERAAKVGAVIDGIMARPEHAWATAERPAEPSHPVVPPAAPSPPAP